MSSGSKGALLTLLVVAGGGAAMDYHYLRGDVPMPIAVAGAQDRAAPPQGALSVPLGPVGPIPGPARALQREAKNPYADDPQARVEGRRMFVAMNCSGRLQGPSCFVSVFSWRSCGTITYDWKGSRA